MQQARSDRYKLKPQDAVGREDVLLVETIPASIEPAAPDGSDGN